MKGFNNAIILWEPESYIHQVITVIKTRSYPRFGLDHYNEYQPSGYFHVVYYESFRVKVTYEVFPFKTRWMCVDMEPVIIAVTRYE